MPSFEIPDGPTTVALKTEAGFHKGNAVFGVTNKTGEGLTARFSVQVQGNGKAEWYSIQGEPERPVAAGENQTVTVVAKVPGATPPGQHRIKLRATNVNDPDNDSTDSAAATITIPAVVKPPPAKKKPFPWWILAVAGGVLVLVIGVIIAVVVMGGGPKVPKVIGMDYPTAVAALKKAGYEVGPEVKEPAPDKPLGKVFKQDPEGGKKVEPKGTVVQLTVAGIPTVAVPNVIGQDYPTAVATLEKSGFKVGPAIEEVSGDQPLGLVFKQDPAADAQSDPKAGDVKLTVAVGETVAVPAVAGKPLVAAQALLEDRGFKVASTVGKASGQQPDAVLVQDPVGDTKAPKGSTVTLTVDPGVIVPNLLSPQVGGIAGIQALKNAGVDVGSIGSSCSGTPNMIVAQSIEPKTKVALGTRVNITIASATANVALCRAIVDRNVLLYSNQMRTVKTVAPTTTMRVLPK
jgi:serine/threonine-protein kinase